MKTFKQKNTELLSYIGNLHDHIYIVEERARKFEADVINGTAHHALVGRCSEYESLIEACYKLITTNQEQTAHQTLIIMRTEIELRKEFK